LAHKKRGRLGKPLMRKNISKFIIAEDTIDSTREIITYSILSLILVPIIRKIKEIFRFDVCRTKIFLKFFFLL